MHLDEIEIYRGQKDHKMRNGYRDFKAETREDEERKGFAENNGDYENKHLGLKRKDAYSNDRIKRARNESEGGYDTTLPALEEI